MMKIDIEEIRKMNPALILDPNIFVPRTGILTRYGKKLLEEGKQYYGVVRITNEKVKKYRSIDDEWEGS